MSDKRIPGLFITGTDTNVGKTYVAAMIVRSLVAAGHRVGVYKPAASGCRRDAESGRLVSDDAIALWEAAGRPGELDRVCPQCFAAPLAPHLAARAEGRTIDTELLVRGVEAWRDYSDVIVVEGAGGLFSPLADDGLNIDLAAKLGFAIVLVAANRLGTIHATLATLLACRAYAPSLAVGGIVLNDLCASDFSRDSNAAELRSRSGAAVLAEVGKDASSFDASIDWFRLATARLDH